MSAPHEHPAGEELLRHAHWVRTLARALVRDESRVEDLVQDTWVAALTHSSPAEGKLRPWLSRVVRNLARQEHRGRGRRANREQDARTPRPSPSPDEFSERLEAERRLTDELTRLEEPYRSTLMLRYYEDLQPAEIAQRLGVPGGTVRWRLKRGLEQLRSRLDAAHGGDRGAWCLLMLPLARSEVAATTGVVGASVAVPGLVAMNGLLKIGAATAAALVIAVGLAVTGVLPPSVLPWRAEEPLVVGFRELRDTAPPRDAPEQPQGARVATREAVSPAAPDVVEPLAAAPERTSVLATVVDQRNAPIRGATLFALSGDVRTGPATSGPGGSVQLEIPLSRDRERVQLHFAAAGFASVGRDLIVERGGDVHAGTVALAPGGALAGRVVGPDGRGVSGARITVGEVDLPRRQLQAMRIQPGESGPPTCTSTAGGEFQLEGVPVGHVRVWAHAEGMLAGYTAPVEVRAGQESYDIELALEELGTEHLIRGVVLAPDGVPVPFARLDYRHRSSKGSTTINGDTRAESDGTFEFVLPDDARLWITASDPEQLHGPASATAVETGEVHLVLQLSSAESVRMLVLDEAGEPARRFAFEVAATDGQFTYQSSAAGERPRGEADFRLPSNPFLLRVTAPGHELATAGPFAPSALPDPVEVRLVAVPGIRGVVLAGEEPVAGAVVTLQALASADELIEQNGFRVRVRNRVLDEARSDEDGRFLITARASGSYLLRAEHAEYAAAELAPCVVRSDLGAADVELHLTSGGAIEGRVHLEGGRDATGAVVGISRGDGHGRTARAGESGAFRFEDLTPGPWRVELRDEEILDGYVSITSSTNRAGTSFEELEWSCEVYAGETTYHDLYAVPEVTWAFEGRLTLNGEPAEAWTAMLNPPATLPGGDGPKDVLDADGRFAIGARAPGPYLLVLHGPLTEAGDDGDEPGTASRDAGEVFLMAPVEVGDRVLPWRLDLETGVLVVQGVEPWDGEGFPMLVYQWEGPGGARCLAPLSGDEDGVCRLSGVPAGRARLVRPDGESMDPADWESVRELEIPAGGEVQTSLH